LSRSQYLAPAPLRSKRCPFESDSSILWKHGTARRFRFVYHYHPEIELMHFVEGEGVEFVGDSSQRFKAGHLVLLGSNLPHFWINDARYMSEHFCESCSVAEVAKGVGMNSEIFSRFFRRETGRTFVKALIDLRLSYACKGLASGRRVGKGRVGDRRSNNRNSSVEAALF
jgi:AraC-like DNA-binding protein